MQYTFQFGPLWTYLPQFLSGLALTMLLSAVGIFGGVALGSDLDALAVDDQVAAVDFDSAVERAVD